MKTQVKSFTTTFSIPLLDWLDQVSGREKVTKKAIIEEALGDWKKKYIQQQIRSSYASMAYDSDAGFLAESGMDDYLDQIEKCEK